MVNLKYGKIHCDVEWQWPTVEVFTEWRKDFLSIPAVSNYEVYLVGRFLDVLNGQDLKTNDIDIILVGENNIKEIEEIIYQGTRLGIEKYSVYFDVQWFNELIPYNKLELSNFHKTTVYMHSDKWTVDDKIITLYESAIQLSENLWSIECGWPSWKQRRRIFEGYTYPDPIRIN